ncbi:MAG TPA: hypothetical protein VN808_21110 [Stellaceae bacterium]|nr:hypothetical protein [Stellaceae bacterium]
MTNDERYIVKLNIAHYQEMLELDLDDEKRSAVERLLAEAKDVLATDKRNQQ